MADGPGVVGVFEPLGRMRFVLLTCHEVSYQHAEATARNENGHDVMYRFHLNKNIGGQEYSALVPCSRESRIPPDPRNDRCSALRRGYFRAHERIDCPKKRNNDADRFCRESFSAELDGIVSIDL